MDILSKGLDYSAARISGLAITQAGYAYVIRYVGFPGNIKCVTADEYTDLVANGLRVYAVYEHDTNDAMGGFAGGVAAAKAARAHMDAVGFPPGAVCFFCADRHLTTTEVPVALEYFRGAASVLGFEHTGAYGFEETIWAVQANPVVKYLWQCGAQSNVRDGVHYYQWNNGTTTVAGVSCDINYEFRRIEGEDDMAWDTPLHLQDGGVTWTDPAEVVVASMAVKVNKMYARLLGDDDNDGRDLLDTVRQARTEQGEWAQRTMVADQQLQGVLNAKIDGLVAAVAALSSDPNLTVDQVTAIITDAVTQNLHITGTVEITGE